MQTELNKGTVRCAQEMIQEAMKLQEQKRSIYFRGQDWEDKKDKDKKEELQLLPSIGRLDKCEFTGKKLEPERIRLTMERDLLHRFSRYAYLELKRAPGEWEALFLARHHGLPTRLLDWTSNPLIALFHAAQCKEPKVDAAVWAIVRKNENEAQGDGVKEIDLLREERKTKIKGDKLYYQKSGELPVEDDKKKLGNLSVEDLQNPLRLKGVRILYPLYVHPRMIAQHSFFTIQDNPWSPLEKYKGSNQEKYIDIKTIYRWKVPQVNRWDIVNELERLGIDNRILFPDLDGLAKGLWQLEIIRKSNSQTDK